MGAQPAKSDELIAEYLHDLKVSAWNRQLPRARTTALENEARANIDAALAAAGSSDAATVYGVLDRLGPPSEIVARDGTVTPPRRPGVIGMALAPVALVARTLRIRGWGLAEIAGLLLLIVGPFLLWWIGPIFGIILVRAAAERWSHRAMHVGTMLVAVPLCLQGLVSLVMFAVVVVNGGSAAYELQKLFQLFTPGGPGGAGVLPWGDASSWLRSFSPFHMMTALPALVAGISSGLYLVFSPRYRR